MKKRSAIGIILTVAGVIVVVAGATADWWLPGAQKGFGPHQMVAVAVGVLLLLIGGLICAKCCKTCGPPCEEAPKEEPPPPTE